MTKFILPLIAAAAVMIPMSTAEARSSRDRHHHRHSYRSHDRHHNHYRHHRHYSRRPAVVYRSYDRGYYYRPYSYYSYPRVYRRPGVSFFFGL